MSNESNSDNLKSGLITLALVFIFISFLLVFLFLINSKLSIEDRFKYAIDSVKTAGTIFGGLAILINTYYSAKRVEAMNKTAMAANDSALAALKNAQAAEEKQVTERFSKAIEQLANEHIHVRLGAIYSLERIANDSDKDYGQVMEILTAYIREKSQQDYNYIFTINFEDLSSREEYLSYIDNRLNLVLPKLDLQVVIKIIARRKKYFGNGETNILDMYKTILIQNDFTESNFQYTNFSNSYFLDVCMQKSNIMSANFKHCWLKKIDFSRANLLNCDFSYGTLIDMYLDNVNLSTANFTNAELINVSFWNSNLTQANFVNTTFINVNLFYCNIEKASFENVKNLTAQQIKLAKNWEKAYYDKDLIKELGLPESQLISIGEIPF